MIRQILVERAFARVLRRAEMGHERERRVGVVAGAVHQHQAVLVGLVLVVARDAGQRAGLDQLAEAVQDRREQRADAEQHVEDRRLVLGGDRVTPFDVPRLVADHVGQLVVRLDEVDRPLVDVDVAAQRRERVDLRVVDDLDRVRHVFARSLRPEFVRDVADPLVQERVGHDHVRVGDLLVVLFADLDLGRGRQGERGCRHGGTHHHYGEGDDGDTTEHHE